MKSRLRKARVQKVFLLATPTQRIFLCYYALRLRTTNHQGNQRLRKRTLLLEITQARVDRSECAFTGAFDTFGKN
jgi:hypothetical protein